MSPDLHGNQGSHGIARRIIRRIGTLSDVTRVLIYSGASLSGVVILILAIVYRSQVWHTLLLLLGGVLILSAFAGLAYVVLRLSRIYRIKQADAQRRDAEARRIAAEAHLQWERDHAELLRAVAAGEVKPLSDSDGVFLRNSEALWYRCPATTTDPKGESHLGGFYVTSLRILFVCADYPFEVPIGGINAVSIGSNSLNLIGKTASASREFRNIADPQLALAHVDRSVKAYHRQVDVGFEDGVGGNVPQEVKTAVWQRDGGRCVQCGASDYLEFDHIIPRSKGGAGSVDNVQLLCRRCNLKKGAAI